MGKDHMGELGWSEFSEGITSLRQQPSSMDLVKLEVAMSKLDRAMTPMTVAETDRTGAHDWHDQVLDVHARAASMTQKVSALERDLLLFFREMDFDPYEAVAASNRHP